MFHKRVCGVMLQAGFLSKIKLLVQITGEGLWWVRAGMKAKQKSRTRLYAHREWMRLMQKKIFLNLRVVVVVVDTTGQSSLGGKYVIVYHVSVVRRVKRNLTK